MGLISNKSSVKSVSSNNIPRHTVPCRADVVHR